MVAKLLLFALVLHVATFSRAEVKPIDFCYPVHRRYLESIGKVHRYCKFRGHIDNNVFGDFPWRVSILPSNEPDNSNFQYCEGSFVHARTVLTDARCVYKKSPRDLKVRAGGEQVNGTRVSLVSEIAIHESYDNHNLHYNVALLFLESWFDLAGTNITGICVPLNRLNYTRCFGAGRHWRRHSNYLANVELAVMPNDVCQDFLRKTRLGESFELHKTFLCATDRRDSSTCTRYSGSSLMCIPENAPNKYHLIGIKSWNVECGVYDVPGLYTDAVELREWIGMQLIKRTHMLPGIC